MSKPRLVLARPTPTPSARAAAKFEEGEARLVVNLPEKLHRALKIRAAERGTTIRQYILSLLEADGLSVD